jgi:hypothetical protein
MIITQMRGLPGIANRLRFWRPLSEEPLTNSAREEPRAVTVALGFQDTMIRPRTGHRTPLGSGHCLGALTAKFVHAGADRSKIVGGTGSRGLRKHRWKTRQTGGKATDWVIMVNEASCIVLHLQPVESNAALAVVRKPAGARQLLLGGGSGSPKQLERRWPIQGEAHDNHSRNVFG